MGSALGLVLAPPAGRCNDPRQPHTCDRGRIRRRATQEFDDKVAELNTAAIRVRGRLQAMAEVLGGRQADLSAIMAERLDSLRSSVGQGLQQSAEKTQENLQKLNERLAVIDAAQNRLGELTSEVLVLKDVLANKQARGAYGQGRMEAIIRDGLPSSSFAFQATLANRTRPDCVIHLPETSARWWSMRNSRSRPSPRCAKHRQRRRSSRPSVASGMI